jgi:hypothetical protein
MSGLIREASGFNKRPRTGDAVEMIMMDGVSPKAWVPSTWQMLGGGRLEGKVETPRFVL